MKQSLAGGLTCILLLCLLLQPTTARYSLSMLAQVLSIIEFDSLTPDTTMSFNLQTSGMQTQSRGSTVVIGEKYLDRFGQIMTVVERIHEDTQALPYAIYVETEDEIKATNISSRVTPSLVRILYISLFWTDLVNHLSVQILIIHSGSYSSS